MSDSSLRSNFIANNGEDYLHTSGMWSDGLTVGFVNNAKITANTFQDNTDVDLILGGATGNSEISGNTIRHYVHASFAALMLTNWSDPNSGAHAGWADFRGLLVSNNFITCGDLCDIAVQLGLYAWNHDPNYSANFRTMGGAVINNTVMTNKQGVNITGAGTSDYVISVYNNIITTNYGNTKENTPLYNAITQTSTINLPKLWQDSFVYLGPGSPPFFTTNIWYNFE